ncbi:hypothetical protein V8E36_008723 [Tilletia maclaganii]
MIFSDMIIIGKNIISDAPHWAYLRIKKVWRTVDPGVPPADDASEEAKREWQEVAETAHASMYLSSASDIQEAIDAREQQRLDAGEDEMTPKELLAWLDTVNESKTKTAEITIIKALN